MAGEKSLWDQVYDEIDTRLKSVSGMAPMVPARDSAGTVEYDPEYNGALEDFVKLSSTSTTWSAWLAARSRCVARRVKNPSNARA